MTEFFKSVGLAGAEYSEAHRWSIEKPEEFWSAVWDFCEVVGDKGNVVLRDGDRMPGAQWFPEARLNFAENLLRRRDDSEAIVFWGENGNAGASDSRGTVSGNGTLCGCLTRGWNC